MGLAQESVPVYGCSAPVTGCAHVVIPIIAPACVGCCVLTVELSMYGPVN